MPREQNWFVEPNRAGRERYRPSADCSSPILREPKTRRSDTGFTRSQICHELRAFERGGGLQRRGERCLLATQPHWPTRRNLGNLSQFLKEGDSGIFAELKGSAAGEVNHGAPLLRPLDVIYPIDVYRVLINLDKMLCTVHAFK